MATFLLVFAASVGPTSTAALTATTTTITSSANPTFAMDVVAYTAIVSPNPGAGLVVRWLIDDVLVYAGATDTGGVSVMNRQLAAGTHAIYAELTGGNGFASSRSAPLTEVLSKHDTSTTVSSSANPAFAMDVVAYTAVVNPNPGPGFPVAWFIDGVNIYTGQTDPGGTSVMNRQLSTGIHVIYAQFVGSNAFAASQSSPLSEALSAPPGTAVAAHAIGVTPSIFYPVHDGYLDKLTVRGALDEPATVSIAIYSVATGKKVRAFSLGPRSGSYRVAWDGRSVSGLLQPAGKYQVVQLVRDVTGNKLTVTSYATLSLKRLYWKTATQTRRGADIDDSMTSEFGFVTFLSRYPGGVFISGNIYDQWADVTYHFTLPKAVAYKGIRFSALGRSQEGSGSATVLLYNYKRATFGVNAVAGPEYGWYSTPAGSGPDYVYMGSFASGVVIADGSNAGTFDVAQVRLTYTYGILH